MTNSDTAFGLHNKITKLIYQKEVADDNTSLSNVTQSFGGNLTTAKNFFLTAEAQALNDTNGTQLEYAIHADGNGLIFTIAFGTKGAGTAAEDDWAAKWKAGKKTLSDAGGWFSAGTFQTPLDANVSDPNMETSAANNTKSDDECKAIQPRYAVAEDHTPHLF